MIIDTKIVNPISELFEQINEVKSLHIHTWEESKTSQEKEIAF